VGGGRPRACGARGAGAPPDRMGVPGGLSRCRLGGRAGAGAAAVGGHGGGRLVPRRELPAHRARGRLPGRRRRRRRGARADRRGRAGDRFRPSGRAGQRGTQGAHRGRRGDRGGCGRVLRGTPGPGAGPAGGRDDPGAARAVGDARRRGPRPRGTRRAGLRRDPDGARARRPPAAPSRRPDPSGSPRRVRRPAYARRGVAPLGGRAAATRPPRHPRAGRDQGHRLPGVRTPDAVRRPVDRGVAAWRPRRVRGGDAQRRDPRRVPGPAHRGRDRRRPGPARARAVPAGPFRVGPVIRRRGRWAGRRRCCPRQPSTWAPPRAGTRAGSACRTGRRRRGSGRTALAPRPNGPAAARTP
jgi:hypothetical protein